MSININGTSVHPNCTAKNSNFRGATFTKVNMHHSDFRFSDFDGVGMYNCNVSHCNFSAASFVGAALSGTNFQGANLAKANFSGALFNDADFRNTDLRSCRLEFGFFQNMVMDKTTLLPDQNIPSGDISAWKVLWIGSKPVIAQLVIPANAKKVRPLGSSRKLRAECVKVISVSDGSSLAWSNFNKVEYRVGETVTADRFDSDIRRECTNGIHFFLSRQDAVDYSGINI